MTRILLIFNLSLVLTFNLYAWIFFYVLCVSAAELQLNVKQSDINGYKTKTAYNHKILTGRPLFPAGPEAPWKPFKPCKYIWTVFIAIMHIHIHIHIHGVQNFTFLWFLGEKRICSNFFYRFLKKNIEYKM